MENLDKILAFILEIDKLKTIYRRTPITGGSRLENDSEHSWHIAVMAMLLKEYYQKPLNLSKSIEMLLIHDLVEIYAGDTYAYDVEGYKDKEIREQMAAKKLFGMLPSPHKEHFWALWEEFEAMQTNEAEYAAMMDRLQPFLLNYYNDGLPWIENGITKAQVLERMSVPLTMNNEIATYIMTLINDAVSKGYLVDTTLL